MPIYEFYCGDCHRIFSFLSRSVQPGSAPACPRCGRSGLSRRVSLFAISRGRKEEPAAAAPEAPPLPGVDEERLERAMASLASEAEGLDDEDPRSAARMMRRLFGAAGLPVGAGMEEALRRMESGEDPEAIEEDLGDVLEQDPFLGALGGDKEPGEKEPKKGLASLGRRLRPPSVDPTLYEM